MFTEVVLGSLEKARESIEPGGSAKLGPKKADLQPILPTI
jgi:hypothetical protein